MSKSKLKKVLFVQGGKCFYCKKHLSEEGATLDHIIARSLGGSDGQDNIGACCKEINQLFANMPVKRKIEIIVSWGGQLPCPKE